MIYHIQTYCTYGYWPEDLKPKSHKLIIVACNNCGCIRTVRKDGYVDLCRTCARKKVYINKPTLGKIGYQPFAIGERNTYKTFSKKPRSSSVRLGYPFRPGINSKT